MSESPAVSPARASVRPGVILFAGVLLLLATSRWGSYLHIPGVPIYIGDVVVLAAAAQAVRLWRKGLLPKPSLRSAPTTGWLVAAFFLWAMARVVTRTALPMVAVRDLAPYAYVIAALLTFLFPTRSTRRTRMWIYAALTIHATWYAVVTVGLIDPANTWQLADGAPIFSTRPDFDAAVFGIAIAFALHQIAFGPRPNRAPAIGAMAAFVGLNGYGLSNQHSRSGLIAAVVAVAAVIGVWILRPREGSHRGTRGLAVRGGAAIAAVIAAVSALLFTVPGQRLVGGIDSSGSLAAGTSHARVLVAEGVSDWLLESPVLTAFGVGYGPNFLARSKTVQYLEGTEFTGVRSPHNYLLGTWARLGLIGAALAVAIFLTAGRLALAQLSRRAPPADILAALIVLTIPVVALFGVVLESPFGAIPYFWAVGQLCARARRPMRDYIETESTAIAVSAGA